MNNEHIALPDPFSKETSSEDVARDVLSHHPSNDVIKAYLAGQLQRGQSSPERFQALNEGQSQDWRQAEVGLHIKVCEQCWQAMVQFRTATQVETTPEKPSWWEVFWAPLRQPIPLALGGALVFIIAVTIGYQLYPWINTSVPAGGSLPPPTTSSIPGQTVQNSEAQSIVNALEAAGVPLDLFDFEQTSNHLPQSGETLQTLAIQYYEDASLWIGIYLANYETLSSLNSPATDSLPATELNIPALR